MDRSIFNKVYSYRQREGKNDRENFIIEIFAYCLEKYPDFCGAFLETIKTPGFDPLDLQVSTQQVYGNDRPDIEIRKGDKLLILIECKVESGEGKNQLDRYRKIIDRFKTNNKQITKLIYLTKYHEEKKNADEILKWDEVYSIIPNTNAEILKEFKKYMEEQNLNPQPMENKDIEALNQITYTISKMDKVLEIALDKFKRCFGGASEYGTRSYRMQYNYYPVFRKLKKIRVEMGFAWDEEDREPYLYAGIGASMTKLSNGLHEKMNEFGNKMRKVNKDYWDINEEAGEIWVIGSKAIKEFLGEKDDIKSMGDFLINRMDELDRIKNTDNFQQLFS